MPKLKAIGTPLTMQNPTRPTKKITRSALPIFWNQSSSCHRPSATTPAIAARSAASRHVMPSRNCLTAVNNRRSKPDQLAGDFPGARNLQRRRRDRLLLRHIGEAGNDHDQREQHDDEGRKAREEALQSGRQQRHDDRHAHMLAAAERDRRAEADQPEKQDAGELVAPDKRTVQHVAPEHAGRRGGRSRRRRGTRRRVRRPHRQSCRCGRRSPVFLLRPSRWRGRSSARQPSGPVYCSSADHSVGPNLPCHSL